MAITIVVGNFKGGVGKTKVSVMASWELAFEKDKKVLLVDMDPQGNASTLIARSTGVTEINASIFDGFKNGSLKECIVPVTENLHMIPAQVSFKNLPKFLYANVKEEIDQVSYLRSYLIRFVMNMIIFSLTYHQQLAISPITLSWHRIMY